MQSGKGSTVPMHEQRIHACLMNIFVPLKKLNPKMAKQPSHLQEPVDESIIDSALHVTV